MEEQFVLRVPPALAARLDNFLKGGAAGPGGEEVPIDLSFQEDGRKGTFSIGEEKFQANLYDLPCVVESFKTYDDQHLVKSADVGQMILVQELGQEPPPGPEFRHGLAPPFRDVRKRWFRQDPDIDPALVASVERDLVRILQGGTAKDMEVLEEEEEEAPPPGEEENKERSKKKEDPEERRKRKEEKRKRKEEKKQKKLLKKQKKEQERAAKQEAEGKEVAAIGEEGAQ